MIWTTELEALASRVANRNRIPRESVKAMVEHCMKELKSSLYDPSMPKIILHKFGTFKVNPKRLDYKIKTFENRVEKGLMSQEDFDKLKAQLESNRDRILNER